MTFDHSDLIVRKLIPSQMRALWEPDSPSDLMESGELQILRGWRGCQLDSQECLSLDQILHSFSAPISEEHAWAVIHQVSLYQLSHCLHCQQSFMMSLEAATQSWLPGLRASFIYRIEVSNFTEHQRQVYWRCYQQWFKCQDFNLNQFSLNDRNSFPQWETQRYKLEII